MFALNVLLSALFALPLAEEDTIRTERLDEEPEIAERIGEPATLRAFRIPEPLPLPYDKLAGIRPVGFQEERDILRKMLAVGIQGDSVGDPRRQRGLESSLQGLSLAAVPGQDDHPGRLRQSGKQRLRTVGTSVQDHEDIGTLHLRTRDDIDDGPGIVVSRDYDADASAAEGLLRVCQDFRHVRLILAITDSPA